MFVNNLEGDALASPFLLAFSMDKHCPFGIVNFSFNSCHRDTETQPIRLRRKDHGFTVVLCDFRQGGNRCLCGYKFEI